MYKQEISGRIQVRFKVKKLKHQWQMYHHYLAVKDMLDPLKLKEELCFSRTLNKLQFHKNMLHVLFTVRLT